MASTKHPGITDRRIGADRKPTKYDGSKPYRARHRDKTGVEECQSFRTIREAQDWLAKVRHAKIDGSHVSRRAGNVTFGERFKIWYATTSNLRPSTRARDRQYYATLIEPTLGDVKLSSIDRDLLAAWVAKLVAAKKAPATVVRAHQIVSKVLRASVPKCIPVNPADQPDYLPKIETDEMNWLDAAHVWKLADRIDPRYRALVALGGFGGLRIGEQLALRRSDLDLDRGLVKVRRTLVEVRGEFIENQPKTKAGRRDVPLQGDVVEELEAHLDAQNVAHDGYVFAAPQGGPVRVSLFRRRFWTPATKAAGVEGLRIHDLRHSAIVGWLRAGVPVKTVAAWAGHKSVATVLDVYGKYVPEDDAAHIKALEAVSRKARKTPLASVSSIA